MFFKKQDKVVNKKQSKFLNMPHEFWICLLLVTVILAVYWQTKDFDFILFDDDVYVTENQIVKKGLSLKSVISAFSSTRGSTWIPVTWLSFMIDYELYGLNPGGFHMTNVLFHILNTVLLFFIFIRMTGACWRCGFVAGLFALHPLHVESVAWIAERKDVLSTFFWMLAIWTYVSYAEKPGHKKYLLMFLFFVLGLLAKPMIVTLPFVLVLLDLWPLGRFAAKKQNSTGLIVEKIPLMICAVADSFIVALINARIPGAAESFEKLPFTLRMLNAFLSYVIYIGKMFWPQNLAVLYPHLGQNIPKLQAVLAGILLVCISCSCYQITTKTALVLFWVVFLCSNPCACIRSYKIWKPCKG